MKSMLTLMFIFAISTSAWSHEGHDKTPGALAAPHGGQIKGTNQMYLELVSDSEGFKIYPFDHDFNAIPLKEVKLEGTFKFPKKNKAEAISFQIKESYFEAKIDAKGNHRYTVDLKVVRGGKSETLSFNVEPQ